MDSANAQELSVFHDYRGIESKVVSGYQPTHRVCVNAVESMAENLRNQGVRAVEDSTLWDPRIEIELETTILKKILRALPVKNLPPTWDEDPLRN